MIYVIIQFFLLFYMGHKTPWENYTYHSIVLFSGSIILGIWAIHSMGLSNLSIFSNPKVNSKIKTTGPYKIIRHPMYTAVLIFSFGMLLMNPILQMYLALFLLIIDLVLKLRFEEKKLQEKFEEYTQYKKTTYYLIPFIY